MVVNTARHNERGTALRLLFRLARSHLSMTDVESIRRLATDVDWQLVKAMSVRHGVVPLVFANLQKLAPTSVPAPVLADLQEACLGNVARSHFFADELTKWVELLNHHGIAAIPYKGPALAVCAYGDVTKRQFRDLDILVPRRQYAAAAEILSAAGLERAKSGAEMERDPGWGQMGFHNRSADYRLELQHGFSPEGVMPSLDEREIWTRLEPMTLAGRSVPHLSAADLFLALAIHGTKHGWERLSWICDVAELLSRQPGFDWNTTLTRARTAGCQRVALHTAHLAGQFLGAPLPAEVHELVQRDRMLPELERQVFRFLLEDAPRRTLGIKLAGMLYHLCALSRHHDRWQRLRTVLFPNELDRAFIHLPSSMCWLYFAVRPVRIIRNAAARGRA